MPIEVLASREGSIRRTVKPVGLRDRIPVTDRGPCFNFGKRIKKNDVQYGRLSDKSEICRTERVFSMIPVLKMPSLYAMA